MTPYLLRILLQRKPAQVAARRAARSWKRILSHIDADLAEVTGKELYDHARQEATKWLESTHRDTVAFSFSQNKLKTAESLFHAEFMDYVEAFICEFPQVERGYPKE
jgi:hypothetical protein